MTAEVEKVLREASDPDFWGEVTLGFKAGQIITLNLNRSISVPRKRDYPYDSTQTR